jgi:selenocysteine lyase/cysteine desulfurase
VIPIQLEGISHFKAAAILGHEFGIGVRSGCFCAHPYLLHLFGLNEAEATQVRSSILAGDRRDMPGLVRLSFGLYNTVEEIDAFVEAVEKICRGEYRGSYTQDPTTGEFSPEGWRVDFDSFLKFLE